MTQPLLDAISRAETADLALLRTCARSQDSKVAAAFRAKLRSARLKARLRLLAAAEGTSAPRGTWIDVAVSERLSDAAPSIRQAACDAIQARRYCHNPARLVALLLRDSRWIVRSCAADAMQNLADERFTKALVKSAEVDRSYLVRRSAAAALSPRMTPAIAKTVARILNNEREPTTRLSLALLMVHVGETDLLRAELKVAKWFPEERYFAVLNALRYELATFREVAARIDVEWFRSAFERAEAANGGADPVRSAKAKIESLRNAQERRIVSRESLLR
ncbi:MAG: HEAT repeat domain-containing protein [Polyangiaceae bacterium]